MGAGKLSPKIWTCAADFRRVFETGFARKQCDAKLMAFPELDVHRDRVTQHVLWRAPTVELHDL